MIVKYGLEFQNEVIVKSIDHTIGQIYKLLPTREEGKNWQKPLETIIVELGGMSRMLVEYENRFFPILNKLEGLFLLEEESEYMLYRRTIFECLNLIAEIENDVKR